MGRGTQGGKGDTRTLHIRKQRGRGGKIAVGESAHLPEECIVWENEDEEEHEEGQWKAREAQTGEDRIGQAQMSRVLRDILARVLS